MVKLIISIIILIIIFIVFNKFGHKVIGMDSPHWNLYVSIYHQTARAILQLLVVLIAYAIAKSYYNIDIFLYIQNYTDWIKSAYIIYSVAKIIINTKTYKEMDYFRLMPRKRSSTEIEGLIERERTWLQYDEKALSVCTSFAPVSIIVLIFTGAFEKPNWLNMFLNNTAYIFLSILLGIYVVLLGWRFILYKNRIKTIFQLQGALADAKTQLLKDIKTRNICYESEEKER